MRFFLINKPAVQEDMRLTAEQRERLDQLAPAWPEMPGPGPFSMAHYQMQPERESRRRSQAFTLL